MYAAGLFVVNSRVRKRKFLQKFVLMKKSVTLRGRFVAAAETQNDAESLTDAGSCGVVSPETICI